MIAKWNQRNRFLHPFSRSTNSSRTRSHDSSSLISNENSQSTSICSVQEPIIAGLDIPVLPASNDIPVLHVVDSSAHDNGSVTCPTVSSESAADEPASLLLFLTSLNLLHRLHPGVCTFVIRPSLSQCSEPTIQSTSVIAAASTVLPVSSTVESHTDNDTNKCPQTSSSPITTPPRKPRSSIMSSEDDDEEPPEAGPETETREINVPQQRLSELEALVEQQNADLETLQSRMTRQDAEARKRIANMQSEHRSRVEHLQRTSRSCAPRRMRWSWSTQWASSARSNSRSAQSAPIALPKIRARPRRCEPAREDRENRRR